MTSINLFDRRFMVDEEEEAEKQQQQQPSPGPPPQSMELPPQHDGILAKAEHKVENGVGNVIGKLMNTICCCCCIVTAEVTLPFACAYLCCKAEAQEKQLEQLVETIES